MSSHCRNCGHHSKKTVQSCPVCGYKMTPEQPAAVEVIAREGMRVHVFSPNKKENWGLGVIACVEDDGYPKEIRLGDGRVVEGVDCWWHPVKR